MSNEINNLGSIGSIDGLGDISVDDLNLDQIGSESNLSSGFALDEHSGGMEQPDIVMQDDPIIPSVPEATDTSMRDDVYNALHKVIEEKEARNINQGEEIQEEDDSTFYDKLLEELDPTMLAKVKKPERINLFYTTVLKGILSGGKNKSKIMQALEIRQSYTCYHSFVKGTRLDLPATGLNSIAEPLGYDVLHLPVPRNISDDKRRVIDEIYMGFFEKIQAEIANIAPDTPTGTKSKTAKPKIPEVTEQPLGAIFTSGNHVDADLSSTINPDGIGANDTFQSSEEEQYVEDTTESTLNNEVQEIAPAISGFNAGDMSGISDNVNVDEMALYGGSSLDDEEEDDFDKMDPSVMQEITIACDPNDPDDTPENNAIASAELAKEVDAYNKSQKEKMN